ncbi:MAG: hypothetical protein ABEJ87_02510 [Candidatus Nanohalobium sp.]
MTTEEKILDLIEVCQEQIDKSRETIEEEIGEPEDDIELSLAKADFPGDTKEQLNALNFYTRKKRKLETAKNSMESPDTSELQEKVEELEEKYAEHSRKDNTHLTEAYGTAINCLENAVKLLNGEEYEVKDLWKTGFRKYPDEKALNSIEKEIENDLFHKLREKHVHHFLSASRYLETIELDTKGKSEATKKKIGNLEDMKEKTSEISCELLEKAENLDFLLLNASAQIRKAEEFEN